MKVTLNPTRLCLWLALCAILGLSAAVYTLRQERARDLRDMEGLAVRAATLQQENANLKAKNADLEIRLWMTERQFHNLESLHNQERGVPIVGKAWATPLSRAEGTPVTP